MNIINTTIQLETIACWLCGCTFAMSADLKANMKSRKETLFCPKGCRLGLGEPEWKKKLERALESEEYYKRRAAKNRERAERIERQLSATRGVVTRIKKRVAHGVCPCCQRTFVNLARHMKAKHSGYGVEEAK